MLDPIVRSAFIVLIAWLLKLAAHYFNFPLDDTTVNTLAAVIVAYILSKLGVPLVRAAFPALAKRGIVSDNDEE